MKPFDEFNRKFKQDIFPPNWINPKPQQHYDLLVVGGGPGGMTAATVARSLNASVALVEKEHLGGECLSYGCIPSKAFLRSSRVAQEIRNASDYGMEVPKGWKVNFNAVMERVYRLQTTLSPHDSADHFKKIGIDVFLGEGHFTGPNKLEVGGQTLNFKKALIVTGTQPILLNLPGLNSSDYRTNQDIFQLSALPPRLVVIGGGPIGCELSQAFLRFGSKVTLITHASSLIPKDDPIASERLQKIFEKEGMKVFTRSSVERVEKKGTEKILYLNTGEQIVADELLVAIGRMPAVEGLHLEMGAISYDKKKGILTNDFQQTSNSNVYAAGDVTSPYKFTHMSTEMSTRGAINALKGNQEKISNLIVPWSTFTDPEVAHIGINEQEAEKQGLPIESILVELTTMDRAILDGQSEGFVKLIVKKNSDQIVGGTLMAAHAGEMISELSVAMKAEKGLLALSQAIHPFPTQAQILRTAAQTLLKKRLEN